MRVERVGKHYGIVLSEEAMESLHLSEGAAVEVLAVTPDAPIIRYATEEEVMDSYRKTLPRFRADYAELAK